MKDDEYERLCNLESILDNFTFVHYQTIHKYEKGKEITYKTVPIYNCGLCGSSIAEQNVYDHYRKYHETKEVKKL